MFDVFKLFLIFELGYLYKKKIYIIFCKGNKLNVKIKIVKLKKKSLIILINL